jgi:tripartite-type tricarboxylate transporter receptor subunit TctC
MKRSSHAAAAAVFAAACLTGCAAAAQTAPFYLGKQLTVLINFTPGGPTDTEGRLVARHLGAHIPGNPAIIARNIPGAGGLIGANFVGEVAPPDGLTLGYFTGFGSKAMMADPALRVNILKFAFVAAGPGISVTYIRSDVPPGLKVPADILKAKDFWAGGLTPDSDKDVRERMELDFLGLHYNYISGYKGSPEARLAVQQNEIQMYPESMPTYRSTIEPALVKTGQVIPVWYDPLDDGETFSKSPDAEGIPALPYDQFLKQVKGELPKTQMWDAYRVLNAVGTSFLRVLVMPPGTPPEEVAILQKALADLDNDADYKADAMTAIKFVPRFLIDDKTVRLFHNTMNPDPKLRQFLQDYIAKGEDLANSHK